MTIGTGPPTIDELDTNTYHALELECSICQQPFDDSQVTTPCRECKQPVCHDCLETGFKVALNDKPFNPFACCGNGYYHALARGLLNDADYNVYKQRLDIYNTTMPLFCANNACNRFIPPREFGDDRSRITCPSCDTETCYQCRDAVMNNLHDCSLKMAAMKDDLLCWKYRQCPKCGFGTAKMHGCNHIECQHCGARWCWKCRLAYRHCDCSNSELSDADDADADEEEDWIGNEDDDIGLKALFDEANTNEQATTNQTNDAELTATTASETDAIPQPETTTNLDGGGDERWEDSGFDFGSEPDDSDLHETWGCPHSYDVLTRDMVPTKWMRDSPPLNVDVDLECMVCFSPCVIKALSSPAATKLEELAYVCYHCGRICCLRCRSG
jgi:hypothetical protein